MGKNKKKNNVALPWDESGGAGGEDSPPAGGQSTADSKAEDEAPLDKKSEAKGTGSSFDWMASNDDTAWGSKSKGSKKKDYLGAFDDPGSKKKDNSGTFDGVGGKKKDGFGAFGDLGGGTTNDYMSSFNIGTAVTEDTSGYDWFDSGDKGLTDHIGSVKKDDEFKPATTSTNAQAKKKKNKFSTEAPATEATNYEATTSYWDTNLDDKEDFKSTATNSASKDKKNKKNATETLSEDVSAFTTSGSFWETKEDAMNEPSKSSFSWDAFDSKPADDPPEDSSSPWAATATKKKKSKKGDEKSDAAKEDTKVSESTAAPEEDWMSWDADKGDKKGKKGKSIFGSSANAAADENIPPVPPIPAAEEATKNSFFDVDTEDNWGNNWGATAAKKGKVGKESNGDSGKTSAGIGKKAAVLEKSDAMSDKPKAQAGKAAPDPSFGTTSGLDEGKDTKVAEAAAKKAKKKGKKGDVAETKEDDFGDRSKSKDNSADLGDWGSFAEVSKSKGATGKSATGSGKKTVESEKANADVSSSGVLRPDGVDEPKQAEAVGKKGKRKGGKKADPVEVNDDLFGDTADFKQQPTAIDEPDFGADDPPTEGWGWNAKKKDKKDGKTKINGLSVTEEKPTAEPKPDLWDVSAGGDDQYDDDFLSSQPAASAKKGKAAKDGTTPAIVSASTTVKGTTKAGKEKKVREPETLESPKEDDAWAFWGGAKKNDKGKDDQAQKIEAKGKPDGKTTAKSSSIQPPSTDKEIKKPIVPSTGNSIADRIKKLEEKKGGKRSSEAPFESMLPQSIPATESFAAEPDVKPSKVTSKKKEQTDKAKGDKISKDSSIIPGGFPSILEDGVGTGKDKKTTKKNAKSNPEDIKAATSKDKSPAQESAFVTTAPDKGEKADKTDKGKSKGKTKADSSLFDDFMDTPTKENPKIGEDPMISSGQEKGEKSKSKNKSKTDGISVDGRAETLSKDKSRSVEPKTSPSIAENPDKSKTKGKPKADVSPTAERVSAPSVDKGKGVEPKSSSTVQDKGDKTKSKSKTKAEPVATDAPQEDSSRPKTTVPSTSWGFWGTSAAEEAVTPEPEEKPDKKKKKPTGPEPTKPTESTKTKSAKPVTDKPKASHDALASPPPPSPAQAADSIKRSKTTSSRSTEKQTISKIKEQPASKNIPAEEEPPTVRPANPKRSSFMGFFASPASTGGKDEAAEAPDIPVIDKGRSIKSMEPEMSAKAAKVLGIRSKADKASVKPTKKSGVKGKFVLSRQKIQGCLVVHRLAPISCCVFEFPDRNNLLTGDLLLI